MERLDVVKVPAAVAKFVGERLLGGAWAELPPLPQGEIKRPVRAHVEYSSVPELPVPENIVLGEE